MIEDEIYDEKDADLMAISESLSKKLANVIK